MGKGLITEHPIHQIHKYESNYHLPAGELMTRTLLSSVVIVLVNPHNASVMFISISMERSTNKKSEISLHSQTRNLFVFVSIDNHTQNISALRVKHGVVLQSCFFYETDYAVCIATHTVELRTDKTSIASALVKPKLVII